MTDQSAASIEHDLKRAVCESVRLVPEGLNRYRVFTPFLLDDGDHLAIVLKQDGNRWVLSDEGHTYMHLTYDLDEKDFQKGTRATIIDNALTTFSVEDRDGELRLPIPDQHYGDALYSFVQAILKVSDVTFLTRERVRSTFVEDVKDFLVATAQALPGTEVELNWHDPDHDAEGKYSVDAKISKRGLSPLFVYALPNDDRVRDATIGLLQYERWNVFHRSVGVFENQEGINRKVLARFSDVCEKMFSSFSSNRERITGYIATAVNP
ncbi:MAG TPA: DUF1828 domain-containing protein [Vicinamibacterales bacterium]|jgi:hypothetical protein